MAKNVEIICRYYQVREIAAGEMTENLYDLRGWLSDMVSKALPDKCKEVNGIKGRLENQVQIDKSERYALNFMRMEEFSSAYILTIDDAATHVDVDITSDEYIAKNTVCLYDAENGIMMIQSNRGSYSEKSIESYINSFYEQPVCVICPILENVNFLGDNAEYMKLDLRLANLKEFEPTQGASFEKILDGINCIDGVNAHIEISLGPARNRKLNGEEVRKVINDLNSNRGCVTSAKIKLTDDQISGIYDLFESICYDKIRCEIDSKGEVGFETLALKMNNRYYTEHSINRIMNALNNE